jgi:hypothetical protein
LYRSSKDIDRAYRKYFSNEADLEGYWLAKRLEKLGAVLQLVPARLRSQIVRKFGGRIFVVRKAP